MSHDGALRVVVGGRVAAAPGHGGAAWAVLQYLLGLRRLGHDVHFVEHLRTPVPAQHGRPDGVEYCRAVMDRFELAGRWCVVDASGATAGMTRARLAEVCRRADLLVDLSGAAAAIDEAMGIPRRLYIDIDPGFTAAWHAQGLDVGLDGHTHHATVGTAVGGPGCVVPTFGLEWILTLPPVVLAEWPDDAPVEREALTTVGHWRAYGTALLDGAMLGQRVHAMRPLLDLPRRTGERFCVALDVHPGDGADREALHAAGWELLDPRGVAATPGEFRQFVAASRAEIGIPKAGYVTARTGWMSDRSTCYLAAGRPVVMQDTGLPAAVPTGRGLLVFDDLDSAVEAVGALRGDLARHARWARQLAEDLFDSRAVLGKLLDAVCTT
ncbi:MAG TPA: hypothetical protein VFC09_04425 [Candidatus Dormibacteraeota bacterium]|nr:hypothetical protein [Candidatus Dormibacteraeota bacterium]